MKLYELTEELRAVQAMTDEAGELAPEAIEALERLELDLSAKLQGCCKMLRSFESEAAVFQSEIDRLQKHLRATKNNATSLKDYIERNLMELDIDRLDTGLFKLRIQRNPPGCQVDVDVDPSAIPADLQTVTITVNRRACIDAYKQGVSLPPGITVTQTRSLRIS